MRSDQTVDIDSFANSGDWQFDAVAGSERPEIDSRYEQGGVTAEEKQLRHSFSGHERNCWFHNDGGGGFSNLSALSGVDSIADGRAHAVWDFDRDGRQDIALVNANEPFLNLYHNRIRATAGRENGFIAIRLVGGNRANRPSSGYSNRDGYGAIVTLDLVDREITREHRCGEGFAAQNSPAMLMGVGSVTKADIAVEWPSGRRSRVEGVNVGSELTVYENASEAPNASGYSVRLYAANRITEARLSPTIATNNGTLQGFDEELSTAERHVITSMATWCEACQRELPQIAALRSAFAEGGVGLWAVPIDPIDSAAKLTAYVRRFQPRYSLIKDLTDRQLESFQKVLRREDTKMPLPMSVIVNARGEVLRVLRGVPSVSDVGIAGIPFDADD